MLHIATKALLALVLVVTAAVVVGADRCKIDFAMPTPHSGSAGTVVDLSTFFQYTVSVNGGAIELGSGDTRLRANGQHVDKALFLSNTTISGFDVLGSFTETSFNFMFAPPVPPPVARSLRQKKVAGSSSSSSSSSATSAVGPDFTFSLRQYDSGDKLVFKQHYHKYINQTAVSSTTGDNSVATSFPSFVFSSSSSASSSSGARRHHRNRRQQKQQRAVGMWSPTGFMAGSMYPSYGSTETMADYFFGGLANSSVVMFFSEEAGGGNGTAGAAAASLTISPSTSFMGTSWATYAGATAGGAAGRQMQWGLNGNARFIPRGYSAEWLLQCSDGSGVNRGMRRWGQTLLRLHNKDGYDPHTRDITTTALSYSTDNGAYYYYFHGNFSNYQDAIAAVKQYADTERIPYRSVEIDSWWYYRDPLTQGLLNWTAPPSVFPDGVPHVKKMTQWNIMAHSRYFAPNNVYASNPLEPIGPTLYDGPRFEFVYSSTTRAGVPRDPAFWPAWFARADSFLSTQIQDWFSTMIDQIDEITANLTFSDVFPHALAVGADTTGVALQMCMSYPRVILDSVRSRAWSQARVSNDFQPSDLNWDYDQYRIGDSSLFVDSLAVLPAKDNFWSKQDAVYQPHYSPLAPIRALRGRLESLTCSLSNGPVQPSDAIGHSDRALIMRSCREDGVLLRPSQAAAPLDSYFQYKAFRNPAPPPRQYSNPSTTDPVLHFTVSRINHDRQQQQQQKRRVEGDGASSGMELDYAYVLGLTWKAPTDLLQITFDDLIASSLPPDADVPVGANASSSSTNIAYYLAFEANSTHALRVVSPTAPLQLASGTNSLSFEYFTLAPVLKSFNQQSQWVLLGERDKWIAASPQRVTRVEYVVSSGAVNVVVQGAVGELVTMLFVNTDNIKNKFVSVACKIGPEQRATIAVAADGSSKCRPY